MCVCFNILNKIETPKDNEYGKIEEYVENQKQLYDDFASQLIKCIQFYL